MFKITETDMGNEGSMESTQVAVLQTDVKYIREKLEEMYIELKIMRERYPTRSEFMEKITLLQAEHKEFASIKDVQEMTKDLIFLQRIVYGVIGGTLYLFYDVVLRRLFN